MLEHVCTARTMCWPSEKTVYRSNVPPHPNTGVVPNVPWTMRFITATVPAQSSAGATIKTSEVPCSGEVVIRGQNARQTPFIALRPCMYRFDCTATVYGDLVHTVDLVGDAARVAAGGSLRFSPSMTTTGPA
jgi:hypothetical protein